MVPLRAQCAQMLDFPEHHEEFRRHRGTSSGIPLHDSARPDRRPRLAVESHLSRCCRHTRADAGACEVAFCLVACCCPQRLESGARYSIIPIHAPFPCAQLAHAIPPATAVVNSPQCSSISEWKRNGELRPRCNYGTQDALPPTRQRLYAPNARAARTLLLVCRIRKSDTREK